MALLTAPTIRISTKAPEARLLLDPARIDEIRGPQLFGEHHLALAAVAPLGEQQRRALVGWRAGLHIVVLVEFDRARNADIARRLQFLDNLVGIGAAGALDRLGVDVGGVVGAERGVDRRAPGDFLELVEER